MNTIEHRNPTNLKAHPKNESIFGDPRKSTAYSDVLESIRTHGIQEPLIVKEDGTLLAGHMRLACAIDLTLDVVPVRVHSDFADEQAELLYLVDSNTKRRQLTLREIGKAYAALKVVPVEEGGLKQPRGRPQNKEAGTRPDSSTPPASNKEAGTRPLKDRTRDTASKHFGIGKDKLEAAEEVFTKDDVPEEVKEAVEAGEVSVTRAAEAIKMTRAEKARAARAALAAGGPIDLDEERHVVSTSLMPEIEEVVLKAEAAPESVVPPASEAPPVDEEETSGSPSRGTTIVSLIDLHKEMPLSDLKISPEIREAYRKLYENDLGTPPPPKIDGPAPEPEPEVVVEIPKLDAKAILEKAKPAAKSSEDDPEVLYSFLEKLRDGIARKSLKIRSLPDKERTKTLLEEIVTNLQKSVPMIPIPETTPIPKEVDNFDDLLSP